MDLRGTGGLHLYGQILPNCIQPVSHVSFMFSFAFVLGKGKAQRSMEEQRKQSVCLKGDVGFRFVSYIYSTEYGVIYSYILSAMSSHVAS